MTETLTSVISFTAALGHHLSPKTHYQTAPSLITCVGFEMDAKGPSHNVPVLGHRLCMGDKMQAAAQPKGKEVSRG